MTGQFHTLVVIGFGDGLVKVAGNPEASGGRSPASVCCFQQFV